MDSFVGAFVSSADGLINSVGQSGFMAVLNAVRTAAVSASVIAIIALAFNQFLQLQAISLGRFLGLMVKLMAIAIIGMRWSNFDAAASAIQSGMDSVAANLLTMTAPTKAHSIAGAIDSLINTLAEKGNEVGQRAGWFAGAIMSNLITWQLSLLGCLGALIIIYSKVMFAVFVCIAPLFIACFIFDATKDYFYRWVQGAVTYTLYPVITAGVLGMTYNVIYTYLSKIGSQPIETIAGFIPFIAVSTMMIVIIFFIPIIVSGLSGMIQNVSPAHLAGAAANIYTVAKQQAPGTTKSPPPPTPNQPATPAPTTSSPAASQGGFQGAPARMQARASRVRGKP
ncbi:type IV secretion system protein [Brucella anthropi]|uniref:type IV secretion system protein n=1 Tax=Brucella anthropi TaxID=529 RepID=UPI00215737FE|nr:type IV secretion system protein [Brucella anthropi]MCR8493689.1 type IV secretion system protein [Brucella anthropi]